MSEEHWNTDFAKSLGVFLNGLGLHYLGPKGERVADDDFYIIFNAHHEPLDYKLPAKKYGAQWTKILDTSQARIGDNEQYEADALIKADGRSIVILHHPVEPKNQDK